jgi:hypothetical protein
MKIDWKFQPNEDGTSQGWNDSTIAQFKANRLESLTRETIQNSLDARLDRSKPVIIEFKEQSRKIDEIPNSTTLRTILGFCEKERDTQNPDMIRELTLAIKSLSQPKVNVLSIADYNTTGMEGPCEPGFPFYNYVKAVGQSGGSTARAGSHGLGKGAPLACSTLRSIIVATKWKGKKGAEGLLQGRAVLMSFRKGKKIYKGTGYWGDEQGYQAITPDAVPQKYQWLIRNDIGTTVHLLGWTSSKNWRELIIGYAISSFFAAFERNTLILRVGDLEVNSLNIEERANSEAVRLAIRSEKKEEKLDDAISYLACLKNDDDVIKEESQLMPLGRTSIRLKIYEKAPRKIALIRNDMLITESIPGFWKRVPTKLGDFVGVVEVLDPEGSKLIRSMEPPAHNDLSKDWLPTPEDQRKGGVALDRLAEELKKFTERHAGGNDDVATRIEFMADFFEDEAGDDRGQRIGEEFDPNGRFTFSPRHVKLLPPSRIPLSTEFDDDLDDSDFVSESDDIVAVDPNNQGDSGGGAGENAGPDSDSDDGDRDGEGSGDGQEGANGEDGASSADTEKPRTNRDKPERELALENVRIVKISSDHAKIYLTSPSTATVTIRVHEVGADIAIPFEITATDKGNLTDGAITLKLKSKERLAISVRLSREIIGGLKLIASQ